MRRKIIQGLGMTGVVLSLFMLAPGWVLQAFLLLVAFVAGWEWAGVSRIRSNAGRAAYAALILACSIGLARWAETSSVFHWVVRCAALWWVLPFLVILACELRRRSAIDQTPALYVPYPLIACAGFAIIAPAAALYTRILGSGTSGNLWMLFILALVAMADTGGQFVGRMGSHKMTPAVSPNKTWEGLLGGAGAATLLAVVVALCLPLPWPKLALIGIATALASVVGDLSASLAKRNAKLKDFGQLLGKHGGIMDRIDGHLAAPGVFLFGLLSFGIEL